METLQRTANRGSISTGPYQIDNSLKFEADNREYLRWNDISSYASSTRKKTFSFSAWVKLTEVGSQCMIWSTAANGYLTIQASGVIKWQQTYGGVQKTLNTNRVFRDTSAWYNIIIAVDSTQSTEANRSRLYVNGVEETSFSSATYPSQNAEAQNVYEQHHYVGEWGGGGSGWCGYIANPTFISDAQITPSDVGEFDEDSGIWIPKAYGGAISSPSYFLEFKDSSNLGNATSGLNVSTLENITSADQATDSPTNVFCTLNPLYNYAYGNTITEGATKIYGAPNNWGGGKATFGLTSGKWYWEIKQLGNSNTFMGLQTDGEDNISSGNAHSQNTTVCFYTDGTIQYSNGSETGTGASNSIAANSIVGFALDLDSSTQTIKVYLDGSLITAFGSSGTANLSTYNLADKTVFPFVALYDRTVNMNFGGYTVSTISSAATDANGYGTFEYAPPDSYFSICTKNLAEYG